MRNLTAVVRKLVICRTRLFILRFDNQLKDILLDDLSTAKTRGMKRL